MSSIHQSKNRLTPNMNLGMALKRISNRLHQELCRLTPVDRMNFPFALCVTGWQNVWKKKKRPRPVFLTLKRWKNDTTAKICRPWKRGWHWYHSVFANTPRGYFTDTEWADHQQKIEAISTRNLAKHARQAEIILSEIIQGVSENSEVVGGDCISIILPYPGRDHGQIRFLPRELHFQDDPINPQNKLPAAFTPWIISQHRVMEPSKFASKEPVSIKLKGYPLSIHSFSNLPADSSLVFSLGYSERKPPPSR